MEVEHIVAFAEVVASVEGVASVAVEMAVVVGRHITQEVDSYDLDCMPVFVVEDFLVMVLVADLHLHPSSDLISCYR